MNVLLQYKSGLTCILTGLTLAWGCIAISFAATVAKDPTRPLVALGAFSDHNRQAVKPKKAKQLKLQSVITQGQRVIAVINDQPVKVGQHIEGYKLIAITAYGVQLVGNGKKLSLSLFNVKIRKK
jgi:hypothetical protein